MIIQYCDKLTTATARIHSNQHKSVAVSVEWPSVSSQRQQAAPVCTQPFPKHHCNVLASHKVQRQPLQTAQGHYCKLCPVTLTHKWQVRTDWRTDGLTDRQTPQWISQWLLSSDEITISGTEESQGFVRRVNPRWFVCIMLPSIGRTSAQRDSRHHRIPYPTPRHGGWFIVVLDRM